MIYLIHGGERVERVAASEEILKTFFGDFLIRRFDADDYSRPDLEEALRGQDLFGQTLVVILNELWREESELLSATLDNWATSSQALLFLEAEASPEVLGVVSKAGGEIKSLGEVKTKNNFNLFPLADAVGTRERRRAWILYQEARWRQVSAEEIFWKLFWKVKTLLLVKTATGKEAGLGLKPYPLAQARRQSQQFSLEELKNLSRRLVSLWHDSRRGLINFEHNLERLLLEL